MTATAIVAQPQIDPAVPTCDYCHAPKAADGSRFCCADHFVKYQIAVAASLPPTTITVTTMRERREGKGAK